ncbi:ABC transporter permease [Consotaella aegiceratis]|uniref:ABC transporter permease n=1 Tax=Consotaella aegiceratis TaxID=3097961 RepID=UPI002F415A43
MAEISVGQGVSKSGIARPIVFPIAAFVLVVLVFGILVGPRLFSAMTLATALPHASVVAIIAFAEMLVLLTAGIDVSLGAITVLASVIMAQLSNDYGMPAPLALGAGLSIGAACGAVNGALVGLVRLPSFIATFGTWFAFDALAFLYSAGGPTDSRVLETEAPLLSSVGRPFALGEAVFSYSLVLAVLMAALLWYLLHLTAWGRHARAVGERPEAAWLCGLRPTPIRIATFVAAGLICSLAAWALIGGAKQVEPTASLEASLQALAAVLIGRTSFAGGRASVTGTLIGAATVTVFVVGLQLLETDPHWARFGLALFILSAAALDRTVRSAGQ